MSTTTRGTSNGNQRGSSADRRARKNWLLDTYRANVDLLVLVSPLEGCAPAIAIEVPLGEGERACRCYRCGDLLTFETLTVDRITPGCKGGTYRRNNIRPACSACNSETGGPLANGKEHQAAKKRAQVRRAKGLVVISE